MHLTPLGKRPRLDDEQNLPASDAHAGQNNLRVRAGPASGSVGNDDAYVRLNVAGKPIDVPGDYLRRPNAGMLGRLTDGSMSVERDSDGRIRLDADPKTFRHILWYWRHNKVPAYLSPPDRDMLAVDAEYLGLFELSTGLKLKKIETEAHLSVVHQFKYADALYDAGRERHAILIAARAHGLASHEDGKLVANYYLAQVQAHPTCLWRQVQAPCFVAGNHDDGSDDPASPVEACLRARVMLQYRQVGEAKRLAELALREDPRFTEARAVLTQALAQLGEYRNADIELRHLRGVSAHHALALAACKSASDDYQVALSALNTAVFYNSNFVTAYIERALTHQKFSQHRRAAADFAKAADLDPNLARHYGEAGGRHHAVERHAEAEHCLKIAAALEPDNAEWQAGMGKVYLSTDWKEAAIRHTQRAVQLRPFEAIYHYLLSSSLDNNDQDEDAIDAIRQALHLDPNNAEYRQHLGDLHFQIADYDGAIAAYERVCALEPSEMHAHVRLAQCFVEIGRYKDAQAIHQRVIDTGPLAQDLLEDLKQLTDCLAARLE